MQYRNSDNASIAHGFGQRLITVLGVCFYIRDVTDDAAQDRATDGVIVTCRARICAGPYLQCVRRQSVVGDQVEKFSVESKYDTELSVAQALRAVGDHLENRLYVCRRAGNDFQDLAGRRLLLECLADLLVANFQRLQKMRVVQRDQRLVGKGLEELDL